MVGSPEAAEWLKISLFLHYFFFLFNTGIILLQLEDSKNKQSLLSQFSVSVLFCYTFPPLMNFSFYTPLSQSGIMFLVLELTQGLLYHTVLHAANNPLLSSSNLPHANNQLFFKGCGPCQGETVLTLDRVNQVSLSLLQCTNLKYPHLFHMRTSPIHYSFPQSKLALYLLCSRFHFY